MRLGAYPCRIAAGSLLHRLYGQDQISERHRHRFEVNNAYRDILAQHGLSLSGTSPRWPLGGSGGAEESSLFRGGAVSSRVQKPSQ